MKKIFTLFIIMTFVVMVPFANVIAADGDIDTGFNIGNGFNATVHSITVQPDGKILVGGAFTSIGGNQFMTKLVRLNTDGTFDDTYQNTRSLDGIVYSVVLQPDGKILVGGSFSSYNTYDGPNFISVPVGRILRLNTDGSIDSTFNSGAVGFNSANEEVKALALQPDGKILVGGKFTSYNGDSVNRLVRLNADGSRDETFNTGTGIPPMTTGQGAGIVNTIALQSNGKILVGGYFTSYDGNPVDRLVRLNTNGSYDDSFEHISVGATNGNRRINKIVIQSDDKIIIGGDLLTYNGVAKQGSIRLHPDGSHDESFTAPPISTGINTISIQTDGKIIIGGNFNKSFERLNYDGSTDNTFNVGAGFSGVVYASTIQSDNKILVGGNFTSYDGTPINRLIRLDTNINNPPTANAGDDQVIILPATSATLSGSGTDTDGTIASYAWTGEGNSSVIESSNAASTVVSGLTEGVYTFTLTVTDNQGATGTDDVTITVVKAPVITKFESSQNPVKSGEPFTLSWEAENVTSCTAIGGWSDSTVISGSETISGITADTQYVLECAGAGGTVTESITVTVESPQDDKKDNSPKSRVIGYRPVVNIPIQNNIVNICPANQVLTQDLKAGARDGRYHSYTKAIVTEVKILQAHMNRLGFNSGAVDGILGPITDGAIKRMQTFLGTAADGYVGPLTRNLLNNSCGTGGLLVQ